MKKLLGVLLSASVLTLTAENKKRLQRMQHKTKTQVNCKLLLWHRLVQMLTYGAHFNFA